MFDAMGLNKISYITDKKVLYFVHPACRKFFTARRGNKKNAPDTQNKRSAGGCLHFHFYIDPV
jgi:hypothetical protein